MGGHVSETLFGIDIAAEIASAIGPSDATAARLVSVTPGTRTSGAPSAGTNPTTASYSCRGFVVDYAAGQIDGTLVVKGDRLVSLVAKSINAGATTPKPGDRVTCRSRTYSIVRVEGDAAEAMWHCQVRG